MGEKLRKKDLEINIKGINETKSLNDFICKTQKFFKLYVKSKKGVFFTALLVLMSSVLFTLALLLFYNSLESESRFTELSSLDITHNLYSSIEESILDIVLYETGRDYYEINYYENYTEFNWSLSNDDILNITSTLQSFKTFVAGNYNFVNLTTTILDNITVDIDVNLIEMGVRKRWSIRVI